MEKNLIAQYFKDVETAREYDGYFYMGISISPITILFGLPLMMIPFTLLSDALIISHRRV